MTKEYQVPKGTCSTPLVIWQHQSAPLLHVSCNSHGGQPGKRLSHLPANQLVVFPSPLHSRTSTIRYGQCAASYNNSLPAYYHSTSTSKPKTAGQGHAKCLHDKVLQANPCPARACMQHNTVSNNC